ncbi:hypothetical protein E4T56_gene1383 [Termitomyces sp. T112]|nr:hypothetical protein E4T56_gene1383 [Termitomyces sp. T112]
MDINVDMLLFALFGNEVLYCLGLLPKAIMPYPKSPSNWTLSQLTENKSSCSSSLVVPEGVFITTPKSTYGHSQPMNSLKSEDIRQYAQTAAQRLSRVCGATGRVDYDRCDVLLTTWKSAYAVQAQTRTDSLVSACNIIIDSRLSISSQCIAKQKKSVFNHEYTPLLEKYFEFNAYPSAPDRAVLARKCMMSPRQIEVWFQNHRSRAKKEGKLLRKLTEQSLPPESSLDLSLKSLERTMPKSNLIMRERSSIHAGKSHVNGIPHDASLVHIQKTHLDPVTLNFLVLPPPSHAFPTVYSSRETNSLFAQAKIYTFPPPVWQRKPAVIPPISKTCIDMNKFIFDFSQKLHLRAPAIKAHHLLPSWCKGRSTVPCQAPHPALVRSSNSALSTIRPLSTATF